MPARSQMRRAESKCGRSEANLVPRQRRPLCPCPAPLHPPDDWREQALAQVSDAASSKSPYRKCPGGKTLCSTGTLLAGALVDRALSVRHPWGGCMNQELRQSLSEFTVISMIVQH